MKQTGQPLLARTLRLPLSLQEGANGFSAGDARHNIGHPTVGDHRTRAGACRETRSTQLGGHPAAPQSRATPRDLIQLGIVHVGGLNQLRIGGTPRIAVHQAILIGQNQ